jgi:hypothetical protein
MFAVALSALALAGAVPVSGGTAGQRAVVRHALAGTDPGAVTSARIDARHYLVLGAPRDAVPSVRLRRAVWEAEVLAVEVEGTLAARGEGIAGYEVGGMLLVPYHGPPPTPPLDRQGARRLLADVRARATGAGLGVPVARVLAGGAVDVAVRLREDQLLDANGPLARFFTPLSASGSWPRFLAVEAPDGTAIAYGGTFGGGGSWNYGGDSVMAPVPKTVPAELWHARTDIVVHVSKGSSRRTVRIRCGGSLPAPRSRCRRVLADRWALLVPPMPGIVCGGVAFGATVQIDGIFAGRPLSRGYDSCYEGTALRWVRFLGV